MEPDTGEQIHVPLEEQIVEWGATRPAWQRAVLRRVAAGDVFSEDDYERLVDALVASEDVGPDDFSLGELPQVKIDDPPVSLVSIADPEHVNALASDRPLTFEARGLTIVYGDNASGKSGYARLLKRIARARNREEILSDVFHDTVLAKPTAALKVTIGKEELSLTWPEAAPVELRRMLFYDEQCGRAYISTESDFPYRPSALFVMDGLIDACVAVRSRIDRRLEQNGLSAKSLPVIDDEVRETEIANYLVQLSGRSSIEGLEALFNGVDVSAARIKELRDQEARLRIADSSKERQKLTRRADKLDSLRTRLIVLEKALGDDAVAALQKERDRVTGLREAADLLANAFDSEPLSGVGLSAWKELWASARRFSETDAYPDAAFPVVEEDARCVLCQQPLGEEARGRLPRFERFVRDDTQTRLRDARRAWEARIEDLRGLQVAPETEANLKDLEPDYPELVSETRELLARFENTRVDIIDSLPGAADLPRGSIDATKTALRLQESAAAARTAANGLSDPERTRKRLAAVTERRKELELLHQVKAQRELVSEEIGRLRERESLEAVKNAAATGPITKKILELSEDSITEVLRDTFTRETDRLHLERVTITKTRGDRGALLHRPKLVGNRQNVTLPRVFSEGEQTALGLAAFFTEAHLDASKSALILDDPVSSLDHVRRRLVATRLAQLAETRQVVVFTHDVSFVADLKREANGLGVPVGERSVTRGRGAKGKPGACLAKHPWKAKDVTERLGELRIDLARIKKERSEWDEQAYEKEVAMWAGNLSETWERIFSQEVVGPVLAEGGVEVRPNMVKILARFSEEDEREFQASYSRVSQWAKRHDKSGVVNYVAPETSTLEEELERVDAWFKRVKRYKG